VTVDDRHVYFTARSRREPPDTYEDGSVLRRDKELAGPVEVLAEDQCGPGEIASIDGAVYWSQHYPIIEFENGEPLNTFIGRISRLSGGAL
jgi:hypothetical protein